MSGHQITFSGELIPVDELNPPRFVGGLTVLQRAILNHIDKHESIRPVEAGVIIHEGRGNGCKGGTAIQWAESSAKQRTIRVEKNRISCCKWASTDGVMALRRLQNRGIVQRINKGVYKRTG